MSLDCTALDGWTSVSTDGNLGSGEPNIFIESSTKCWVNNPCIKVSGIAGSATGYDYIERSLDVPGWTDIVINYKTYGFSIDAGEAIFIETVCGDDTLMYDSINKATDGEYTGSLALIGQSCDTLTLRFGGYLSGAGDHIYVTQITIDYNFTSPTVSPTPDPTSDPTSAPTSVPTSDPTSNPTICFERDGTFSNDGYEESIYQQLINLEVTNKITNDSKIINAFQDFVYHGEILNDFINDNKQEMICDGIASCSHSSIVFKDNSICNLLCNGLVSCDSAHIFVNKCENIHIICNGTHSCSFMEIEIISTNALVNIDCGVKDSCNNIRIDIFGNNNNGNISCYDLNSCDDAYIFIEQQNYKNVVLNMLSYSKNITFSNGWGYEENDKTKQYVECNTQNKFIKWNKTLSSTSNHHIESMVLAEYTNNTFPCDDLTIQCFIANDSESVSKCNVQYTIINEFNISSQSTSSIAPCYWVPISDIVDISCSGDCIASPTKSPTSSPTSSPTVSTFTPTEVPTHSPTNAPSNNPTSPPSIAPSNSPTNAPINSPTSPPTIAPSSSPTKHPSFSPTIAPSNTPSYSPSSSPTYSPTPKPTRLPTESVDDIYDTFIPITYEISNLTEKNIYYIVDDPMKLSNDLIQIIEDNYFDNEKLDYSAFWIYIETINDKDIFNEEQLTIYDLDVVYLQQPMELRSRIESAAIDSGSIIRTSETSTFISDTQKEMQTYFNNSYLIFNVSHLNQLESFNKFDKEEIEEQDRTIIILSGIIVSIGLVISIGAFMYNKLQHTKVDNAVFYVPFLVAWHIYDFVSDINLSIQIFKNDAVEFNVGNVFYWLGIFSVVFIVYPFASNMFYAMKINEQIPIQQCPSARAWFGKHLSPFILICVVSAGTYPALCLCSSRLFGLDFFNAGLLSNDLHKLSKIKIQTTVYAENLPQLLIQLLYSYFTNKLEDATILAFIASSLSVIASVIIYKAQKRQNEEFIITSYYIDFIKKNRSLTMEERGNINQNKGLKMALGESLCTVFNISNKSIEIGFVTLTTNGCIIHLQHAIFKDNLDELKHQLFKQQIATHGLLIQITPDLYVEELFKLNKRRINEVFRNHFRMNDDIESNFTTKYHKRYEGSNDNTPRSPTSGRMKTINRMATTLTKKHYYRSVSIGDDENEEGKSEGSNNDNNNENRLGVEMVSMEPNDNNDNEKNNNNSSNIVAAINLLQNQVKALQETLMKNMDLKDGITPDQSNN